MDESKLLTPHEMEAVRQAGLLYNYIAENVVTDGPTREADLTELSTAIHTVQRAVMAQAAARAYPAKFRLLGGTVKVLDELPSPGLPAGEQTETARE